MEEERLVEFKGRGNSGKDNQNFLYKFDSIYLMDNHRAALWCWIQHISLDKKYNILHIDRHYDTRDGQSRPWRENINVNQLREMNINKYLEYEETIDEKNYCFFQWDNYLSIFFDICSNYIDKRIFVTQKEGDEPQKLSTNEILNPHEVDKIPAIMNDESNNWIVNIDLDFFFIDKNGNKNQWMSDKCIKELFNSILEIINEKKIDVLTIALSPECCGGWKESERICSIACEKLGIPFKLP